MSQWVRVMMIVVVVMMNVILYKRKCRTYAGLAFQFIL